MSTLNLCFCAEIREIFFWWSSDLELCTVYLCRLVLAFNALVTLFVYTVDPNTQQSLILQNPVYCELAMDPKFSMSKNLKLIQEAHRPQLAHLSEKPVSHCRFSDVMQHLSNPTIATNEGPSLEQFSVLKKKNVFFYYHYFTIYGHDSQWSVTIWTNSQSCFNSRIDMKLGRKRPNDFWRESV